MGFEVNVDYFALFIVPEDVRFDYLFEQEFAGDELHY